MSCVIFAHEAQESMCRRSCGNAFTNLVTFFGLRDIRKELGPRVLDSFLPPDLLGRS